MVEETVAKQDKKMVMIHIHDLWKSYGSLQVLKGLNLDVFSGETVVVLGRSGVGKSVLLRQIIGIETPDKGYVEIKGQRVSEMSNSERPGIKMGMLFQGSALFDSMPVGENVAFYLRQHESNLKEKDIKNRVAEALSMVGLENTQEKMPSELSGGMRKRAALARVIVYQPEIILYDEPTTGLDPMTAMQINDLINKTKEKLKSTSIVVTHDVRSALEVGDRLAFHHDGKIILVASKDEFFQKKNEEIESFFTNAILQKDYLDVKNSRETGNTK